MNRDIILEVFKRHISFYEYGCWKKDNDGNSIDFCPYYQYDNCQSKLYNDIINFFTPHILTIEEIKYQVDYVYVEITSKTGPLLFRSTAIIEKYDKNEVEFFWFSDTCETYKWNEYGKTWRCWNMIPTEEERKKIGWNNYE